MPMITLTQEQLSQLPGLSYANGKFRDNAWSFGESDDVDAIWKDVTRNAIEVNGKLFMASDLYQPNLKNEQKKALTETWIKRELFNNDDVLHAAYYPQLEKFYCQPVSGYMMTAMYASIAANGFLNETINCLSENLEGRSCVMSFKNGLIRARARHQGFVYEKGPNKMARPVPGEVFENYVLTPQGFTLESVEFSNPLLVELTTKDFVNIDLWLDAVETAKDKEQALFELAPQILKQAESEQKKIASEVVARLRQVDERRKARLIAKKPSAPKEQQEPIEKAPLALTPSPEDKAKYTLLDRTLRSYTHYLINKIAHHLLSCDLEWAVSLHSYFDRSFLIKPFANLTQEQQAKRQAFLDTVLTKLPAKKQALAEKLKLVLALRDQLHQPGLSKTEQLLAVKNHLDIPNRAILNRHRDRFSHFLEKVLRKVFPDKFVDQHCRLFQSKGQRRMQEILMVSNCQERKPRIIK